MPVNLYYVFDQSITVMVVFTNISPTSLLSLIRSSMLQHRSFSCVMLTLTKQIDDTCNSMKY